ncbi:hypothetical protein C7999DRAFT_30552 [Corynascus novoguineensis]|uniref:NB-ARC domain-containing protein n=1 Tax=Corynascus novoguineensis TaxID=1126955 RepID=A0AAN7CVX1_9PEZI|nr:hypothetical protein C7999DRAFT_30552 [Corynascus novoguineensis]
MNPTRPATRADFQIAIICTLAIEVDAVDALFDIHWDDEGPPYGKRPSDPNAYTTGAIGRHNIVLARMPDMDKVSAAAIAANCRESFPNIELALIVGVCGVVPFRSDSSNTAEIVLGDVIISDSVVQYDLARRLPEQFVTKDTLPNILGRPNIEIRSLLAKLKGLHGRKPLEGMIAGYMDVLRGEPELAAVYPGATQDKLFEATYRHVSDGMLCEECTCDGELVPRARLEQGDGQPAVHIGLIGLGNTAMNSGKDRDAIACQAGVIGFETENAGVWDIFPCVLIKGASDYADNHKTKTWQRYAAATAAACMKAFLNDWVPSVTERAALPCHYIPLSRNQHFVGRERTLDTLKGLLFVRQKSQKASIVGLGGVGKTQVALQLAYWAKEHRPEFSIFWVSALSNATFKHAFTAIARKLLIQSDSEDDGLFKSVRRYLSSEAAGPWLLVVDNADDRDVLFGCADMPGGIIGYLPESDNGLILFTTRSREVAVSVTGSNFIVLEGMDPPEAAVFLEKLLIKKDILRDEGATAELLKELTCLPLAITQAAAYINTKQVSLAEYVELLHSTQQETIGLLSEEFRDNTQYSESQYAVATTWFVSFDQIRQTDKAATNLLSFISCIEPKGIPQSLFPDFQSTEQLLDVIETLCAYAILTRREDSKVFDMHSLVHLATRIWVRREGLTTTTTIEKATRHFAAVFPSDDYANRNVWREYLPHAFRVLEHSKELDIEERSDLLYRIGLCLIADGRIKEAATSLEEACQWRNRHFAEDHPSRLASQHQLAVAYQANGQVKEAIMLLEQVVSIRQRTLAEDDADLLASQHALAVAYEANGQVKEAISLLEQAVAICKRALAEDHSSRLASLHALAGAYRANGQVKEAIVLLEQVVSIRERTLAENHSSRLASQHPLAVTYQVNNQAKEAITLLEHVLEIRERTLARDHPLRLASQHQLAGAYRDSGQVKEAIALLEQVVAMSERTLDEDHPNRLVSQQELAKAYQANGQVEEAIALLKQVVAIRERTLAEDHPDRLTSQHTLAGAYQDNGQVTEAIALLEQVVAIEAGTLAKDHPDRLTSQHQLARAYHANGQVEEAITLLEQVVAIREQTLNEDHPDRLASLRKLAANYQTNGRVKEAIALLEQVVHIEARTIAKDHPDRLMSQHTLALAYRDNGQVKEAIALLEQVVAIEAQTLAEDDPDRLASRYELAVAYQVNGHVEEAVALFEQIVSIQELNLAEDDPDLLASQQWLAYLLEAD